MFVATAQTDPPPSPPTGTDPERRGRALVLLTAASTVYVVVAGIVLAIAPESSFIQNTLAPWVSVLPQGFALIACLYVVGRVPAGQWPPRSVYALGAGFALLSGIATYFWNTVRIVGTVAHLGIVDLLYLSDYLVLAVTYAVCFRRLGGALLSPRVGLDAVTIAISLVGAFWAVLHGPIVPDGTHVVPLTLTVPYTLVLTVQMTLAALLWLQMPSPRLYPEVVCLIAAGLVDAAWEIAWLAGWLIDRDLVGPFYNYGDAVCFTLLTGSAALVSRTTRNATPTPDVSRRADSFLPVLFALLTIALLASAFAASRNWGTWALLGLVLCAVLLVVTRQHRVRAELDELNRALARRVADERLNEVVRLSSDLILIVDLDGTIRYASPVAATMLWTPPEALVGTPMTDVFGAAYHEVLERYLADVAVTTPEGTLELTIGDGGREPRVLTLHAVNRAGNPQIGGIVVTISDITEKRALEREVIAASTQERVRLAADIHDGLGQELTGIALLLKGIATALPDDGANRRTDLEGVVAHVSQAIASARDLARGLSPLKVVQGSLGVALIRLGQDLNASLPTTVAIDPTLRLDGLDDATADHLYRIAHEAALNALRHSAATRLAVTLRSDADALCLCIEDDGRGLDRARAARNGLGLRLMSYRTRLIGGTFQVHEGEHGGTVVRVTVPVHRLASTFAH